MPSAKTVCGEYQVEDSTKQSILHFKHKRSLFKWKKRLLFLTYVWFRNFLKFYWILLFSWEMFPLKLAYSVIPPMHNNRTGVLSRNFRPLCSPNIFAHCSQRLFISLSFKNVLLQTSDVEFCGEEDAGEADSLTMCGPVCSWQSFLNYIPRSGYLKPLCYVAFCSWPSPIRQLCNCLEEPMAAHSWA